MSDDQVLKSHFVLMEKITTHYKMRNSHPAELDKAVRCCGEQIALAPQAAAALKSQGWGKLPSHTGFEQLAIIREERGEYGEAIALYKEAKRQGWGRGCTEGPVNWDEKIKLCKRKHKRDERNGAGNQPPPTRPHTAPIQPTGTEPTPAIQVACPHCRKVLMIPIQYAGQRGMCRGCRGLLDVPAFGTVQGASLADGHAPRA